MNLQLSGKITHILATETGESKNGTWSKRTIVIETADEKYPKSVAIEQWGQSIEDTFLAEGYTVTASINIESREWNGRWFTNVKAWKIEVTHTGGVKTEPKPVTEPEPDSDDDLPF